MNNATYTCFRDELCDLLKDGADVLHRQRDETFPEIWRLGDDLVRLSAKLLEDQFTITLVSDFQCGKSTTFNVVCDGRLLSPRGNGLKTSGCRISAQNVVGKPESALVRWRTSQEIIAGFGDLLSPYLSKEDELRFRSDERDFEAKLDINKPEDCRLILAAATHALAAQQEKKREFSTQILDIAKCAALTATFYHDPEVQRFRASAKLDDTGNLVSELKPGEVRKFVRFPLDWIRRWSHGDPAQFKPNEVMFLFISEVRLFLHSPGLKSTGICLVDSPGLFASKWDTRVASESMSRADAILYLFKGQQTITKSDLGEEALAGENAKDGEGLRRIRTMDMEHKLFYGWNMWGKSVQKSLELAGDSRKVMEEAKFAVPQDHFLYYHSALALFCLMHERMQSTGLDEETRRWFHFETDEMRDPTLSPPDPATTTAKIEAGIMGYFVQLKGLGRADAAALQFTPSLLKEARKLSGFDEMMDKVKTFVVGRRHRYILLDNGSKLVEASLTKLEGALESREAAARQEAEMFQRECTEAQHLLADFKQQSAAVSAPFMDTSIDDKVTAGFLEMVNDRLREEICRRVGLRICHEILGGGISDKLGRILAPDATANVLTQIVASEVKEHVGTVLLGWLERLKTGREQAFNEHLNEPFAHAYASTSRLWSRIAPHSASPLVRDIPMPEVPPDFWHPAAGELDNARLPVPDLWDDLIRNPWQFVLVLLGPIGWLVLFGLLVKQQWAIAKSMFAQPDQQEAESLTKSILSDEAWNRVRSVVQTAVAKGFMAKVREAHLQKVEENLQKPALEIARRREKAEADLKLSQANRDRIAAEAAGWRKEHIAPLRKRVGSFVTRAEQAITLQAAKP